MNIAVYLATHNMTVKQLAEKLEIVPAYFSAVKSGRCKPSKRLVTRIKEVTNGEVDLTKKEIAA